MSEIAELEQRIAAAFDRIDRGLEALRHDRAALDDALSGSMRDGSLPETQPSPKTQPGAALPLPPAIASPDTATPETATLETPAPESAAPQIAALVRALETAKASAAEWADRYRALELQTSADIMAMASEIARLTTVLDDTAQPDRATATAQADRDAEIDDLTARIAQQEAELETLRALRTADAQEIANLVAALAPLVQEVPHV